MPALALQSAIASWVVAHDTSRRFDAEDLRVTTSLSVPWPAAGAKTQAQGHSAPLSIQA